MRGKAYHCAIDKLNSSLIGNASYYSSRSANDCVIQSNRRGTCTSDLRILCDRYQRICPITTSSQLQGLLQAAIDLTRVQPCSVPTFCILLIWVQTDFGAFLFTLNSPMHLTCGCNQNVGSYRLPRQVLHSNIRRWTHVTETTPEIGNGDFALAAV